MNKDKAFFRNAAVFSYIAIIGFFVNAQSGQAGSGTGFEITVQSGHLSWVNSATPSDDGKLFATTSRDRSVKLWTAEGALLRTLVGHTIDTSAAVFSPDGALLASGDDDGTVIVWDTASGLRVSSWKSHARGVKSLAFSPDGTLLLSGARDSYVSDRQQANLVMRELSTGKVLAEVDAGDDIDRLAFSPDGKSIAAISKGSLRLLDATLALKKTDSAKIKLDSTAWSPDGKKIWAAGETGIAIFSGSGKLESEREIKNPGLNYGGSSFASRAGLAAFAYSSRDKEGKDIVTLRVEAIAAGTKPAELSLGSLKFYKALCVGISPDGNFAAVGVDTGGYDNTVCAVAFKLSSSTATGIRTANSYPLAIGPDPVSGGFAVMDNNADIFYWSANLDLNATKNVRGLCSVNPAGAAFSPAGRFLSVGDTKTAYVLKADGTSLVGTAKGQTYQSYSSCGVSDDGKYVVYGEDNAMRLADLSDEYKRGALLAEDKRFSNAAAFSPDGEWLAVGMHDLYLLPSILPKKGNSVYGGVPIVPSPPKSDLSDSALWIEALAFDSSGTRIAFGRGNGDIRIVDLMGKELTALSGQRGVIRGIAFSADGKTLYSCAQDGVVKLWNISTGESVSLYTAFGEWIAWTDDGYFDASMAGGQLLAASVGTASFGVDQFAVRNNRPDIILQRLGCADIVLLAHYRRQYERRLERLGLDESRLASAPMDAPEASIVSVKRDGRAASVKISLRARGADLKSYKVWINDVPVFGALGKPAGGRKLEAEEKLELAPGNNKIEVGCLGIDGLESWRAMSNVVIEEAAAPRLYYIGFGVSNYADASLKLGYAAKDAKDLEKLFIAIGKKSFSKVTVKTFTDSDVTAASLSAARALLADARPEDVLVLFIAGHGVHDSDADATYYYLPYGADLKNLPRTAIRFEELEGLLLGIAPRNKLFLMDTCESGEAEKSAVAMTIAAEAKATSGSARMVQRPAERGISVVKSIARAMFKGIRFIYNDLTRRSGSIVFSSCRGDEASWEFSDLGNGAFTAAIKKAFADPAADKNSDKRISTDELRAYVEKLVPELVLKRTGKDIQHPTVDRDNIYQKFTFPLMK